MNNTTNIVNTSSRIVTSDESKPKAKYNFGEFMDNMDSKPGADSHIQIYDSYDAGDSH